MDAVERAPDSQLQRHVVRYGRRLGRQRRLGLALTLAARVVTAIQQDAVDPGPQAGIELDGARRLINFQERFLHRILGVRAIRKQMKRDALHAPGMRGVDLLERG